MPKRIWIVSELYYPEETSTGYFLTRIAEGLTKYYRISVLCSQPTYSARGVRAPAWENRNGVEIHRCPSTTLNKNITIYRLFNLITISFYIFGVALTRIRKQDFALVVTNPPILPFIVAIACRLRGAKCLLLVHDIYPEVMVAAGIIKANGILASGLKYLTYRLYNSVEKIIVLGRDMEEVVSRKLANQKHKIVIIRNWADLDLIFPNNAGKDSMLSGLGLNNKFVIQYSGNIGRTHGLGILLETAKKLNSQKDIHFLFIGWGAKKAWLQKSIRNASLRNVTFLPNQSRNNLSNSLNACDLAIISFKPGMAGLSVPSRMYNVLAAGKPILAVADWESELAMVIREENVGWVVPPDEPEKIAKIILEAREHPECLVEMGKRARLAAERKYSFSQVVQEYRSLLIDMDGNGR